MRKDLFVLLCTTLLLITSSAIVPAQNQDTKGTSRSSDNGSIVDMISQVNASLLHEYHDGLMRFGPRYTGSLNCSLASQYIYDSFEDMDLDVAFHNWSYDGYTSRDVVATLYGADPNSTAEYVLCGHFDTVAGAPGADDDGSGTAAVLAIASVLHQYEFNHTIRFITFSGEEVGTYGSFTYARDASHRGDNIVAVLNMDMIGYASSTEGGRILRFFPPTRSRWIADYATEVAQKYVDEIDMTVDILPNYRGSDHQAFVDYGYDAVWIAHQDGYPWGHSPNDTADHLNWSYYVKATKLMLAITAEIAQKPIDVQVVLQRPYEGYTYLFNHPVFESSFGRRWFGGLRGSTFILGGKTMASAEVFSSEPIKYVIFCVDGNFMVWDSQPPYEWRMQGMYYPLIGKHTMKVYAYTTSGKVASDEMDIFILSLSTAYKG
jgi:hypothetical protein